MKSEEVGGEEKQKSLPEDIVKVSNNGRPRVSSLNVVRRRTVNSDNNNK